MNIEEVTTLLDTIGLSLVKKKVVYKGKAIDDDIANGLLAPHSISIDEVRKIIADANKKVYNIPNDFRTLKKLQDMEIITPAFTKDAKWNKMDERLFKYFLLAKYSDNSEGMVLMVTDLNGHYKPVPLGGNALSTLADITRACASMSVVDDNGVKRTLYDHILHEYDSIMQEALENFKKIEHVEDFGNWAVRQGIPSLMINNYKLRAVHEQRDVEVDENHKETMYKISSLYFQENPFQCIALHYDSLASVPSRIVKMPKLYSNDPDEPAMHHIDLESILDHEGTHPTWDKYMERFSKPEAEVYMAFIWSIFDAENTGRQLLYIYDPQGYSGKSVVTSSIAAVLGPELVAALQKDSINNQFAFSKIWNKRLTIIDDNKNPYLILSEKMHLLLGSGVADVEYKGKTAFAAKLQSKVIANGNTQLSIDPDAAHEWTRVIVIEPNMTDDILKEFCEVDEDGNLIRNKHGKPKYRGDSQFGKNLIKEFRAFLVKCKAAYDKLCPTRADIILPDEITDKIANMSSNQIDVIDDRAERIFVFDKNEAVPVSDFAIALAKMVSEIEIALHKKIDDDFVYQHLIKKYNLRKTTRRVGGNVKKVILGVKLAQSDMSNVVDLSTKVDSSVIMPSQFDDLLGEL